MGHGTRLPKLENTSVFEVPLETKSIVQFSFHSGIVGTLITGHILEVSYSWRNVFYLNAVVLVFGAVIFLVFGTAKKVV